MRWRSYANSRANTMSDEGRRSAIKEEKEQTREEKAVAWEGEGRPLPRGKGEEAALPEA